MHAHLLTGSPCRHTQPNVACPLCGSEGEASSCSSDAVFAAMQTLRERGALRLTLRGGDLLARPEALDLLGAARTLGFEAIEVWTAGPALARANVSERVVAAGASHLAVPLYGDSAQSHDYVTGTPDHFRHVIAGLRRARGAGARVTVLAPLLRPTMRSLALLVRHCLPLDVAAFRFIAPVTAERAAHPILAPLVLAAPHLRSALQFAVASRRRATVQGVPACLLGEYGALALSSPPLLWSAQAATQAPLPEGLFGKPCQGCTWRSRCPGLHPGLAMRLNWSHIDPRTDAPA